MEHMMIDLETMDNSPTSAIIAIGIVEFGKVVNENSATLADRVTWQVGRGELIRVKLQSSLDAGLTINADTIAWWMAQSDEARAEFHEHESTDAVKLVTALEKLCITWDSWRCRYPWGNGSDFDVSILNNAFRRMNGPAPWKFWDTRDVRTLKWLKPEFNIAQFHDGRKHTALADALAQAKQCCAILTALGA